MSLDWSKPPRFMVEPHTNDPCFAFRVKDMKTGEAHGFGMLLDAIALAAEWDIHVQKEGAV